MGYRPRKKKSKPYRKRAKKKGVISNISNGISPYPQAYRAKLRYAVSEQLTGALTTGTSYLFRANSLFDPDVRAGGHQPRGFDELMAAYDHYVVTGAKITVLVNNNQSTPIMAGIYLSDNNTYVAGSTELMERPGATFKTTGDQAAAKTLRLSKNFNTASFFHRSYSALTADAELKGSAATDPNEMAYFGIFLAAQDGLTTANASVSIVIDYTATFVEPSQISIS